MLVNIVHFNDVYNVKPGKHDPVGGASRFATTLKAIEHSSGEKPWVFFSGDAFSPSVEGSITRGSHMTSVLNQLDIDCACVGNHDFDFGVPQLQKLVAQTDFPWLMSNVLYQDGSLPAPLERYRIFKRDGLTIGVIGLIEKECIDTIPSFPSDLFYHDSIEVAKTLSDELRDPNGPHKVDLIFVLAHMRIRNDVKFACALVNDVDLILGGHDHFYYISKGIKIVGEHWSREENLSGVGLDPEEDNGPPIRIVKSGADFREMSLLRLDIGQNDQGRTIIQSMTAERYEVDKSVVPDPSMEEAVSSIVDHVRKQTQWPIGYTAVPLDGRASAVRMGETNLGNFSADLMLIYYRDLETPAEIALSWGGTIRNDSIIDVGELTLGDIMTIFPFQDSVVVVRLTGQQIWDAMENGVSMYPMHEGRFPQVAGLRIEWDPQRPPGQRVQRILCVKKCAAESLAQRGAGILPTPEDIQRHYLPENMVPLDLTREYIVATRSYLCEGYDGYKSLISPPEKFIVDEENGVTLATICRKFFLGLKYLNAFREELTDKPSREERLRAIVTHAASHWRRVAALGAQRAHGDEELSQMLQQPSHNELGATMSQAFEDAVKGHPSCLFSEEDESCHSPHGLYPGHNGNKAKSWNQRWATIQPGTQGRIVVVNQQKN